MGSAARPWRLLLSGSGEPAFNQGLDLALLHSADERPVLRLYGWRPAALSLGHFQPLAPFVGLAAAAGLAVVRRPTGGGAIHHDDELTFCLVATPGRDGYPEDLRGGYAWVHGVLAGALARFGQAPRPRGGDAPLSVRPRAATLCFADHTALDLLDGAGRKLVGSAQRRSGGRVLHHGSIPLAPPALTPDSSALSLLARRAVSWDEAADCVRQAFAARLAGLIPDAPSPAEEADARRRAVALALA